MSGPGKHQSPRRALTRRRMIRRRARLMAGLATALLALFLVLAFLLRGAGGTVIDLAVAVRVQALDWPGLAPLMIALSVPGTWPWSPLSYCLAFGGFFLAGFHREALFILATPGAALISTVAKLVVERPRPVGPDLRVLSQLLDYSYPSGHVVSYVSLYGFVFFLVFVLFKSSWWRTALLTTLGLLIGLVGLSRIYLGYHWLSDVVGGYALGSAYLLLLVEVYRLTTTRPAEPTGSRGGS